MKHLTIRHFGPLQEADILLDRVNLIIGLQGSGKSCVMMLACYCAWVEKRIVIGCKSDNMEIQYDHSKRLFTHRWGKWASLMSMMNS